MKKLLTSLALSMVAFVSYGQTANDFTATDCNNVTHNFFTELNSGKVIVLVWVMPCGGCVPGSNAAYNAVQSFSTSHPGKVKYYLIDDTGDDGCAGLSAWASSNGVNPANITVFGEAGNLPPETTVGGTGMPHIAVVGGPDHKIWVDLKDNFTDNQASITNAISSAIAATDVSDLTSQVRFSVAPNPVTGNLAITCSKEVTHLTISSINGQVVMETGFDGGKKDPVISISSIVPGTYIVRITDVEGKSGLYKIVKE